MLQQENKSINPRKNASFKNYCNKSSNIDFKCRLKYLQVFLNSSIEVAQKYFHNTVNKLINTERDCKVYWSIFKISLNYKKIPVGPPLFYENRFITDFKEKAELFIFFLF